MDPETAAPNQTKKCAIHEPPQAGEVSSEPPPFRDFIEPLQADVAETLLRYFIAFGALVPKHSQGPFVTWSDPIVRQTR